MLGAAVPLWLKLLHTLFVGVLVPVYWRTYGPANFLWFSDLALLVLLPALWLESSLLASTQALSVALLETVWLVDFLVRLITGVRLIGMSDYMFDLRLPRFVRGLSLFHAWLPPLLLWLVWRLGYDPRALPAQTVFAWTVLLVCYFCTKPADNINWVFGPARGPQRRIPSWLYLLALMVLFPLGVYLPSHLVLVHFFPMAGPEPL